MDIFCKVFDSPKYGQILVKIDDKESRDETGLEVRLYAKPEGYGVCSLACDFSDTDDGIDDAQKFFNEINLEKAELIMVGLFAEISKAEEK